jgi:hypothetical protein
MLGTLINWMVLWSGGAVEPKRLHRFFAGQVE